VGVIKLSSNMTFFLKRVFPLLYLGFVAVFVAVAVASGAARTAGPIFFAGPALAFVIGLGAMKKLVWNLVDEVYDGGDYLLIKNKGREHSLSLADVTNVSGSLHTNPPRITLRIANASGAGPLGSQVTFSPKRPLTLNPFAKNPIFEDLVARVDRARAGRRR
jgi:hypothetical protein